MTTNNMGIDRQTERKRIERQEKHREKKRIERKEKLFFQAERIQEAFLIRLLTLRLSISRGLDTTSKNYISHNIKETKSQFALRLSSLAYTAKFCHFTKQARLRIGFFQTSTIFIKF